MLDGNISVEEDTELRDLVMQTLESNGVLAKVRAELRASVFLALEEQETVMNPMPLLNKTVKQYLKSSEGKLLFSLVREFLEYFGLDYTISVYDPETYSGKEYNYIGRNKLCEELGIKSTEPLLGEILKNTINGAFNNTDKNDTSNSRVDKTLESSTHFLNTTFELSMPKIVNKECMNDIDSCSDKQDSLQESDLSLPINATITNKKQIESSIETSMDNSICDVQSSSLREIKTNTSMMAGDIENISYKNKIVHSEADKNTSSEISKHESLFKLDESLDEQNKNEELLKPKISRNRELHMTNNRNSLSKTMFFDEIIVHGKKEKVEHNAHKNEQLFNELPPIKSKTILCNLPPLNGKKEANINDVKEIMERVTDGVGNYDEDFSSPSGSTNEQSPSKEPDNSDSPQKLMSKSDDLSKTVQSDEISEEIDELRSSTSCLDNVPVDKSIPQFTVGLNSDFFKGV